jgi:hypothetical protein
MKLKMIVVVSVALVASVLVGAGCAYSPKEPATASSQTVAYYTCPMHPSVKSDKPGSCSICGMALVPVHTNAAVAKP